MKRFEFSYTCTYFVWKEFEQKIYKSKSLYNKYIITIHANSTLNSMILMPRKIEDVA